MRRCILAVLLVVAACSGSDDGAPAATTTADFLEQVAPDVPAGDDFEGLPTRVDEEDRIVYMADCDAVERATADGGPWGPTPRDPVTQESEPGYASICPT